MSTINFYNEETGQYEEIPMSGSGDSSLVSDKFSEEKDYSVGNYCIKNDVLYKFISEKTAGEWDEDLVESTSVGAELDMLNSKIGKGSSPDYANLIETITTDENHTFTEDCFVCGYITSPASEGSYIKYGSSNGIRIFDSSKANTTISVSFLIGKGESIYIRSGTTVNLNVFGLKNP